MLSDILSCIGRYVTPPWVLYKYIYKLKNHIEKLEKENVNINIELEQKQKFLDDTVKEPKLIRNLNEQIRETTRHNVHTLYEFTVIVKNNAKKSKELLDKICELELGVEEIFSDIKEEIKFTKEISGKCGGEVVSRALKAHDTDYTWIYPELKLKPKEFSLDKIVQQAKELEHSPKYADKKAEFAKSNPSGFGYVYIMTNPSMPGLVKVGHTDNPRVREVELTVGKVAHFRDSEEYREAVRASEPPVMKRGKISFPPPLHEYLETINKSLNTSMPSPFKAQFWMESNNRELDEWFIHEALADFKLCRGAGTEFFVLTVDEAEQVFKALFPNGSFQMNTDERERLRAASTSCA